MGFHWALGVGVGDVHSEQGTLGVRKQMRDKKENVCFKENVEQRLAARKHHSVSICSGCWGISRQSLHLSLQLRPPPAFAFISGVFSLAGQAGKGEQV